MWWLHGTSISSYLLRRRRQRRRRRRLLAAPELRQQPPARRRQHKPPSPPVPAFFNAEKLGPAATAAARSAFASAYPYTYVQLAGLLDDTRLRAVRQELSKLHRTFKETDLFKVYQTGDLGNLDRSDPTHAAALPQTLALRDALYSDAFRAFVRRVTGCAPLTGQTDCSCNVYARGSHLLCHDDVIGTRCVSYILYLSRPGRPWVPRLGGALELYATDEAAGAGCPATAPCAIVPCHWGTLLMFTVQPGVSFHAVAEVLSRGEPRLSVSGWFHAATEPPLAAEMATLAQLQASPAAGGVAPAKPLAAPRDLTGISPKQLRELARFVNPVYLTADALGAVRAQLQHLPYISPLSPLCLPYISPTSPLRR